MHKLRSGIHVHKDVLASHQLIVASTCKVQIGLGSRDRDESCQGASLQESRSSHLLKLACKKNTESL